MLVFFFFTLPFIFQLTSFQLALHRNFKVETNYNVYKNNHLVNLNFVEAVTMKKIFKTIKTFLDY